MGDFLGTARQRWSFRSGPSPCFWRSDRRIALIFTDGGVTHVVHQKSTFRKSKMTQCGEGFITHTNLNRTLPPSHVQKETDRGAACRTCRWYPHRRDDPQYGAAAPRDTRVLRLVMTMEGETVIHCTPIIGYLHRGIEKILENRPYLGGIRYMDNADYLSPMLNETVYAGAVEQLMGIEASISASSPTRCSTSPTTSSPSEVIFTIWVHPLPLCRRFVTARGYSRSSRRAVEAGSM